MSESLAPTIATHALTRLYGSTVALKEVTLTVEPGSVFALVGPNGAGKTTLIQLLMNLQAATSGSAEVLGIQSRAIRGTALNRIGYISESQELPDWMTWAASSTFCGRSIPAGMRRWMLSCCATSHCRSTAS